MKINNQDINFYNNDEDYIKNNLISYYKSYLTQISNLSSISTANIHDFNKEVLSMVSIKKGNIDKISLEELIKVLNKVEEFWNYKYGIVFMP